jgi:hypothetical protein
MHVLYCKTISRSHHRRHMHRLAPRVNSQRINRNYDILSGSIS